MKTDLISLCGMVAYKVETKFIKYFRRMCTLQKLFILLCS